MTPSAKQAHAARMLAHLETTMSATPGPWTFGHLGNGRLWVGPSHEEAPVATLAWDCDGARDEARENARLLSAAPAMLAAMKELVALLKLDCLAEGITDEEWIAETVGSSSPTAEREAAALRAFLSAVAKAEGRS